MEKVLKLPIGIENFEKLRTEGFYHVDETGLIRELLDNWGMSTNLPKICILQCFHPGL